MNLRKFWRLPAKLISRVLIFLLQTLRPLLGPAACKFDLSCTNYAILMLKSKPLLQALKSITKRLISCTPLG